MPQTAGKRFVAVMFFDNQSGNADLDSLRERLADMLITDLSRSNKLTILSRQQLHTLLDHSNYPLVHYHLGRALEGKGSQDQARVEYERFLEVSKRADTDLPEVVQAKRVLTGK